MASAQQGLKLCQGNLLEKYVLEGTLGQGNYGKAVLAKKVDNPNEKLVIKQIPLSDVDDRAREEALQEARMLSQFDHVNIVHYQECVLEEGCLNIVMEYASEGDLSGVITRRASEKKPFTEDEIMFWFVQIVLALYHVHSKNILHRDLKSSNIFISEGNILKLGDFGIARVLNSDTELARTAIGTPYYLSPEICEDRPYNRKSDVWALGCVLYELCTLRRAFDGMSLPALVVKILKGRYPPVPTRYCSSLRGLVDSMLRQNPKERPSVDAILRLSYVKGHVERYAKHVMALSPLAPLGVEVPGVVPAPAPPPVAPAAPAPGDGGEETTQLSVPAVRSSSALTRQPGTGGAAPATRAAVPSRASAVRTSIGPSPGGPAARAQSQMQAQLAGQPDRSSPATPEAAPPARASSASSRKEAETSDSGGGSPATPQTAGSNGGDRMSAVAGPPSLDKQGAAGFAGRKLAPGNAARLVGSTWLGKQQAALEELQGALALQGQGRGRRAAAPGGGASEPLSSEADPDNGGSPGQGPGVQGPPAVPAPPAGEAVQSTSRPGSAQGGQGMNGSMPAASASLHRAHLLGLKQAAREAELEANKNAVAQERERKKVAAAKRSSEAAAAVRNRMVERQREVERALSEQRQKEEEKVRRSEALAAQLKNKEESKVKLRDEIAAHMAAHQQQIKAARARVNRDELLQLGMQFAARLQAPAPPAAQVVVVDAGSPQPAEPSSSRQSAPAAAGPRQIGGFPTKMQRASSNSEPRAGGLPPPAAPPAAAGRRVVAAGAGPSPEPPWRAARANSQGAGGAGSKGFPDVQIYTPFEGLVAGATQQENSPPSDMVPQGAGAAGRVGAGGRSRSQSPGQKDRVLAAWARRGKAELLEVLSQIQEVLAEEEEEEGEEGVQQPGAPAGPRPSSQPAVASAAADSHPSAPSASIQQQHRNLSSTPGSTRSAGGTQGPSSRSSHRPPSAQQQHGLQLPPEPDDQASPAPPGPGGAAHKVEALRVALERELGQDTFLSAYRNLRQMQEQLGKEDDAGSAATAKGQQAVLERLLKGKLHLVRQIHKLITMEDSVFG